MADDIKAAPLQTKKLIKVFESLDRGDSLELDGSAHGRAKGGKGGHLEREVAEGIVKEAVVEEVAKEVVYDEAKREVIKHEVAKEAAKKGAAKAIKGDTTSSSKTAAGSSKTKKTALLVFAHPEKTSFNDAMKVTAVAALTKQGYEVLVSDLYEMKFNPVFGRGDVAGALEHPDKFRYLKEVGRAYVEGILAKDIEEEQEKLDAADLVVFQFPLVWFSLPAILKGWFDRVMCYKYAYGDKQFYDQGRFKGKRALLSFTTRDPETTFTSQGVNGDLDIYLWPIQYGMLRYCGFDVLRPHVIYASSHLSDIDRKLVLQEWVQRLGNVWKERPLYFIPLEYFQAANGFQLDVRAIESEIAVDKLAPTIGQNLGKPLPPFSMLSEPK